MNLALIQPCPPHQWAYAPTVGYYQCYKCSERVNYDDPRYAEIATSWSMSATYGAFAAEWQAHRFAPHLSLETVWGIHERCAVAKPGAPTKGDIAHD